MGSPITEERKLFSALNNCGFTSTKNLKEDLSKPFAFLMDMSMLGVGVGFDVKGAGQLTIKENNPHKETRIYQIPDTREGWVESVRQLLDSYFLGLEHVEFDYSLIREEGAPIKGFGGVSSGYKPLKEVHESIRTVLISLIGKPITITAIVDIMNLLGKCVIAGNVRRTAEIAFGPYDSEEYLDLKNYKINPHRVSYGWTSNNSIAADIGMDYSGPAERTHLNGEPGYSWLHNMRRYSRMCDLPDDKDFRAEGANPCVEQTLESFELCCLVETFIANHDSLEDFLRTLKFAYLYAKTVTLGETHWAETNRVLLRNRRIGCSISGIAQFLAKNNHEQLRRWLDTGYNTINKYDDIYSDWLAIPKSIKKTSIKPSGTVSLLVGATPGVHFPESRYYIRRMRIGINSTLIEPLKQANYHIEQDKHDPNSLVVSVPIDAGEGLRTLQEVSMWEQLSLAAFLQKYWSDNQVSCTVTFDPVTEGPQIKHALNYFQYQLKGISFLPRLEKGAYEQMPYEAIDVKTYKKLSVDLRKPEFNKISGESAEVDKFCNNDACEILSVKTN